MNPIMSGSLIDSPVLASSFCQTETVFCNRAQDWFYRSGVENEVKSLVNFTDVCVFIQSKAGKSGKDKCKRQITNILKNPKRFETKNKEFKIEKKAQIDLELKKAYPLYENSFNYPNGVMILGGETLRKTDTLDLKILNKNFLQLSSKSSGAILCEEPWNLLKNDAAILGAIHSLKSFYCYPPGPINMTLLWDKEKQRTRVLGREILGILNNGYQFFVEKVKPTDSEYVLCFHCVDKKAAHDATLLSLVEFGGTSIKDEEEFLHLLMKLELQFIPKEEMGKMSSILDFIKYGEK